MNRHFNWMDKPVTWGGYFKLCGICTVIGTIIAAVEVVVFMEPAWWKATKNFVRRLFDK